MSLAKLQSQKKHISLLLGLALIGLSSCEKRDAKKAGFQGTVQNFRSSQAKDANQLITLANLGKATLEINKNLGLQNRNKRVVNFSKVIDDNQNELLKSLQETADSKLIIINSIIKNEIQEDSILHEELYFDSIEQNLVGQIEVLQDLKQNTLDTIISEFALDQLQKQTRILELTRKFKVRIMAPEISQIE
ncbi:hypothetical protein [Flavobacterium agrisoli]|uniref:DUF4142 domain-containing protein n=1 Tax=Flavobacterium agrisoli TaxID=2793066 RepID=A0A934PMA5_9FLAO|nr:hypothetical protein [Flavobacterium agrisoli]MBK0369081.1 hypothetical protein [Flavobacterium agrisoli]